MVFTITTITHATAWKRRRACKVGAASGPRGTTTATGAARSPQCGWGSCPASPGSPHPRARRAAPSHTRTIRATTRRGRRSQLARAMTARASHMARLRPGHGEAATEATDATDGGTTRGGCRVAGRVYRGYDLRARPATTSGCAVRTWSVWLNRGATERGRVVETGRMSQVHTAILETGPSQWLSKLLTTDGICIYTMMPCMLQVCDGACWTQSIPTNMGWSGRGDGSSRVVRWVSWR